MAERAVLVCLELKARARKPGARSQRALARGTVTVSADDLDEIAELAEAPAKSEVREPITGVFVDSFEEETAEFRELATSAGAEISAEVLQRRSQPDPATLIGTGKLEEIRAVVASVDADLVLFNQNLTPSQLRNVERELPCRVIDRTQLILDIFARHARTREGHLQVELAQLEYLLPRLTGRGAAMSQLGGGIGTRGPGETKLETDRRRLEKRMDHIRGQLEAVRRTRRQQRQRRETVPVPTVALVGYTNAGKSTLFNALTQAGVLESKRMFATLDPKLRAIVLPSRRRVLLADTVGFVRQLPHTLVTSFRATLEEVEQAEVLIHVRDAASPTLERQKEDVERVLAELGAGSKPRIEVLNKADLLSSDEAEVLRQREAGIFVSGLRKTGVTELLKAVETALHSDPMQQAWFRIPQSEGGVLAAFDAGAMVLRREFVEDHTLVEASGPVSLLGRYRRYRLAAPPKLARAAKPAKKAARAAK
jgi:GTP-binding protein HflX